MLIVYSKRGSQTEVYQSTKSIYLKTVNRWRMYLSFFIVWGGSALFETECLYVASADTELIN